MNSASVKTYYEDVIFKEGSQDELVFNSLKSFGAPVTSRMLLRWINDLADAGLSRSIDLVSLRRSISNLKDPNHYDPIKIQSVKMDKCPVTGKTVNWWAPVATQNQLLIKF